MCFTFPSLRLRSRPCRNLANKNGLKICLNKKKTSFGCFTNKPLKTTNNIPKWQQKKALIPTWALQWHLSEPDKAGKQPKEPLKETYWNNSSKAKKRWAIIKLISIKTLKRCQERDMAIAPVSNSLAKKVNRREQAQDILRIRGKVKWRASQKNRPKMST